MKIFAFGFLVLSLTGLIYLGSSNVRECDQPINFDTVKVEITEMSVIPAGEFTMGVAGNTGELLPHTVYVSSFKMDKHEVTNAQYHAFCQATDRDLPTLWGIPKLKTTLDFPDHPILGVSNSDARAYAEWCGKRLPTEAEWEYAARGGLEGMKFDRGDTLDVAQTNTGKSKIGSTVAVASYLPNGYGLYDMIGNLREWVSDYYAQDYFSVSPKDNPQGPDKTRWRVIKGGGWHSGPGCNRVVVRNALRGTWGDINVGLRCAQDLDDINNN